MSNEIERLLKDKKLLIFDFDGTIADTSPLHEAAFNQVLLPFGIKVDYSTIAGMTTADAMMRCLKEGKTTLDAGQIRTLVAAKQALVRQMIDANLQPLPGADKFLKWAKQKYRMSMATSGSRGTVGLALKKLGYTKWFDPLICAEDTSLAKPHPQVFQRVLDLTGYSPNQALVFEDSEAGLESAKAACIDVVQIRDTSWIEFTNGGL